MAAAAGTAGGLCRPRRVEADYAAAEYRLLPLRVHLLRSALLPDLHCKLQRSDVERILGKINRIWDQAGIQFYAESILSEEAASQELYKGLGSNRTEGHLRLIRPRESVSDQMFHLYYIGAMRPNGICLQSSHQLLFVKESARLNKVPGGLDEDLPRVSAHEIGHALGLDHRQDMVNLMASGTTGISLNEAEINTARGTAESFTWMLLPERALARAARLAEEKDVRAARALYATLARLPGDEPAGTARRRLRELRSAEGTPS